MKRLLIPISAALVASTTPVFAEEPAPSPAGGVEGAPAAADDAAPAADKAEPAPAAAGDAEPSPAEQLAAFKEALGAIDGPYKGAPLSDLATIDVPAGSWFVPKAGMALFNRSLENLSSANEVGALVSGELESVVYFEWEPIGYVKDDEDDLDADDLLSTMRENMEAANAQRRQRGYAETELIGWVKKPFYNNQTRSLEWATSFREIGDKSSGTSNYNTRRLGRAGVMSVVLASTPEEVEKRLAVMNEQMKTFAFVPGQDYASFKEGDRIAEIGLGALVVGGGAVALAKVGFFKKFWKILAGLGALIVGGLAKLFGRKRKEEVAPVGSHGDDAGQG